MVIPRFVEAAKNNKPLIVHGDGTQRRVFCHIEDAIDGILKLWDSKGGSGEAFNLGGFEESSIKDLAGRIIKRANSKSTIEHIPYSQLKEGFEDIERRVPSSKKLENLTGWKARKGLDEIIDDALAHLG